MSEFWESSDKLVKKRLINAAEFSNKPTERATCYLRIENISVNESAVTDLKKYQSEIVDGCPEKVITIGDANAEIDRQIERGIMMMMISEKSTINVLLPRADGESVNVGLEVTLTGFDGFKPIWEWTPEEKYNVALKYKEAGGRLYKESRHVDAFHKFSKACKILITLEPIPDLELEKTLENDINHLRLILYNNMAGCQLSRKNYERAISLCDKVLQKDPNNVKALYRRGLAHGNLKAVDKATADLKRVITLEPYNRAAKEQYQIYNAKLQEANQRCDDMVRRMFKI